MYYVPACGSDKPHHPHPMPYPTFLGLFKQEQKPPKKNIAMPGKTSAGLSVLLRLLNRCRLQVPIFVAGRELIENFLIV